MTTRPTSQASSVPVVGIVLSGTGSDGTAGLRTIMAAGGVSLVQEPGSAKYTGLPQSAIEAGVTDVVLTAGAMADKLVELSRMHLQAHSDTGMEIPAVLLEKLKRRVCRVAWVVPGKQVFSAKGFPCNDSFDK